MSRFFSHLRQNRTSLFFFLTALATLLACVLRTLAFFFGFDAEIGYFRTASPLVIAMLICTLLCIGFGVTVSFLINKKGIPTEANPLCPPRFIAAALSAVLLCVAALFVIFRASEIPAPALLVLVAGLSLLGAAVYFLLRLCIAKLSTVAAFGFFTVLAAATVLAVTYFDRYTQMNAPHKLSIHLCMLAVMFAMLYELRALLSRPMPRACTAATTVAASLCTVYALSNAIAFIGGVYDSVAYFLFDLVALGFAFYFITKCVALYATPTKPTDKEVEE